MIFGEVVGKVDEVSEPRHDHLGSIRTHRHLVKAQFQDRLIIDAAECSGKALDVVCEVLGALEMERIIEIG